jgi:hypothetical protein
MGWRADGGLWLVVRGGGLFLSKGTGVSDDFEEARISSRGFGILDVGYRSKVSQLPSLHLLAVVRVC